MESFNSFCSTNFCNEPNIWIKNITKMFLTISIMNTFYFFKWLEYSKAVRQNHIYTHTHPPDFAFFLHNFCKCQIHSYTKIKLFKCFLNNLKIFTYFFSFSNTYSYFLNFSILGTLSHMFSAFGTLSQLLQHSFNNLYTLSFFVGFCKLCQFFFNF